MKRNKTIAQLKPGDKIYWFCYKKESIKNDCSWEDDTTPWDYIGSIGTHLTGAPYLGNIHEAVIYAPTEIRDDDMFVYIDFISDNGTHRKSGGVYVDKKYVNSTVVDKKHDHYKFRPEYNTKECDKFEFGTLVISTNKDECHTSWSAVWNDMFSAIEHEMCKLELWKRKLIKWSDLERNKNFNEN